jgi:acid phosphatase (class A)
LALCSCSATAVNKSPKAERTGNYLTTAQVAGETIPPPPVAGSAQDKADLGVVRDWNAKRTLQQFNAALAQAGETYDSFFGEVSPFARPAPPEVAAFLDRVANDVELPVSALKKQYDRPRPFIADPADVIPCTKAGHASYPSGHTTLAYTYAFVLSDLAPQKRAQFEAYAAQAGLNRVICGVHYPADVAAGKMLAGEIYADLSKSPAFKSDLDHMRAYLKH